MLANTKIVSVLMMMIADDCMFMNTCTYVQMRVFLCFEGQEASRVYVCLLCVSVFVCACVCV